MNSRIRELLEEIREREEALEEAMKSREVELLYRFEGTKVKFEESVKRAHHQLKVGLVRWLRESSPRNVITAPVIYGMVFPFLLLDFAISTYQLLCFPLYRIARVNRRNYIVVDRHQLSYLNSIEKLNCTYCGYINGLIGYTREIVSRTEQFWCPIKHARKVLDPHRRYMKFADFGESMEYQQHIKRMRAALAETSDQ